ncbi:MAG: bifunctional acetate--CoA ligase family protein/GNAT family N-acetyltransferase [Oxalobacteraceae bacterium]|nr:bifunctional acetate--CoA ligase family protein/GNAT family N-acetyltransferase [Oxalobacteraceae bacterium]
MSLRNLEHLFSPKSVALIGASDRPHSVGATVWNNLSRGYAVPGDPKLMAVNPRLTRLQDWPVYPDVASLPQTPELAVIATPPATVPKLITQLAQRGTRAAVILTAGMDGDYGDGRTHRQAMLDASKPYIFRVLGPNCVGLLAPALRLNASFAPTDALPGKVAFVSQSGALVTAVLDWARARDIGFSYFISLGDATDVDVGDVLDYLATDPHTQSILLYVEDIRNARKFMSAARAAGRNKPVVILKAGRVPEGARAAASHTGLLRVLTTEALFDAVETLARAKPLISESLIILTNGGGPGVMATDALMLSGGKLATLSEKTMAALDKVLPLNWSRGNPIDIIGDAPVARYQQALSILFEHQPSNPVLFIHAPTAIVPSADIARALAPAIEQSRHHVIACWMGGASVGEARQIFSKAGLPHFGTPEDAIQGFMQVVEYGRNQQLLMQVPAAGTPYDDLDVPAARAVIDAVLAEGRVMLTEPESKMLMQACHLPIAETRVAHSPEEAAVLAEAIGFPVAVKLLSPDITHKTEVGGVALDLESVAAVKAAATAMQQRLALLRPAAKLKGFSVQPMIRRPDAQELIVGITSDPVFGPVLLFGQGGIAVEVLQDHALALPPLNDVLARDTIMRTRVSKLLAGYRNRPAADMEAISRVLIQVAHLAAELPEIAELDINPLLADANGVIALDARVLLKPQHLRHPHDRLAIRPYPQALEEIVQWRGSEMTLRPIRPEDGESHLRFFSLLDPVDVRFRMFIHMRELQPSQLARMTQIDYDREMAFVAVRQNEDGSDETLGVVRAVADPDNINAEFAIIIRSDLKGLGLGQMLMTKLITYFRQRGTKAIVGEALGDNHALIELTKNLGFEIHSQSGTGTVALRLPLN